MHRHMLCTALTSFLTHYTSVNSFSDTFIMIHWQTNKPESATSLQAISLLHWVVAASSVLKSSLRTSSANYKRQSTISNCQYLYSTKGNLHTTLQTHAPQDVESCWHGWSRIGIARFVCYCVSWKMFRLAKYSYLEWRTSWHYHWHNLPCDVLIYIFFFLVRGFTEGVNVQSSLLLWIDDLHNTCKIM